MDKYGRARASLLVRSDNTHIPFILSDLCGSTAGFGGVVGELRGHTSTVIGAYVRPAQVGIRTTYGQWRYALGGT